MLNEENIRLIFGLKVNQLRSEQELTLSELSDKSGLSISYLTEIEKGKKYPKPDKLASLASALDIPYDELVSLKLSKNLAPVSELLQTNILNLLPLDFFGIEVSKLIDLVSKAPAKLGAFIKTFVELGRNYQMRQEHLYFAVLRSYQELHDNYFEEIEKAADSLMKEVGLSQEPPVSPEKLEGILKEKYNFRIVETTFEKHPELLRTRSLYIPAKGNNPETLLINKQLTAKQKAFIFGRELGFRFLNIKERPATFSWLEVESFEQLHNNFKASYFSGAILIEKSRVVADLKEFLGSSTFQPELLQKMLVKYNASSEMFFYRLTNILPKFFNLRNMFFLRFNSPKGSDKYHLTKELHLNQQHNPHGNRISEHYCRRWVTVGVVRELENRQKAGDTTNTPVLDAQISDYIDAENDYFCISMARGLSPTPDLNSVVTLGFLMNTEFKRKVRFWNDELVKSRQVNSTCERCPLTDCTERAAPSIAWQEEQARIARKKALQEVLDEARESFTP